MSRDQQGRSLSAQARARADADKREEIQWYRQHAASDRTGSPDAYVAELKRARALRREALPTEARALDRALRPRGDAVEKVLLDERREFDPDLGTEEFWTDLRGELSTPEGTENVLRRVLDIDPDFLGGVLALNENRQVVRRDAPTLMRRMHPLGEQYLREDLTSYERAHMEHVISLAQDDPADRAAVRISRAMHEIRPDLLKNAVPTNTDEALAFGKKFTELPEPVEIVEEPKTAQEAWERGLAEMPLPALEKLMHGELQRGKPAPKTPTDTRSLAELEARMKQIETEERDKVNDVPAFDDVADNYSRFFPTDDSAIKIVD